MVRHVSTRYDSEETSISGESKELIEIEGDPNPSLDIPNKANILIISRDQSYLTHGIHKFPAKFFPELPRYLIRKYSDVGDTVLDPMCGSGTVVLEAMLNNRIGIGIDIDPIAQLITRVKTTPISHATLKMATSKVIHQIESLHQSTKYIPSIPEFHYRDNWFRPYVLDELATIRDSFSVLKSINSEGQKQVLDFFNVALSSIIREVSNADPHCTRTVLRKKVIKNISPGDTLLKFSAKLNQQVADMKELTEKIQGMQVPEVVLPKTSALQTGLEDSSVDLAVTSPPYINAVDYPRTHQLEMYWLGLLGDGPLSRVKRKYIGTETVYKNEYQELKSTGHKTLDPILEKIYNLDPRRSFIVYKFFEDMESQIHEMKRVLRPGGRYCIAIGNNLIRGVRVKSHEILAEIAESSISFELEKIFFSKLIRHFIRIPRRERMHGEWVLILRKPS
jgi:DNA modification methylase